MENIIIELPNIINTVESKIYACGCVYCYKTDLIEIYFYNQVIPQKDVVQIIAIGCKYYNIILKFNSNVIIKYKNYNFYFDKLNMFYEFFDQKSNKIFNIVFNNKLLIKNGEYYRIA